MNKNHKIESYINYLVYLKQKNINDCNGVEKYVKEALKEKDYKFIPHLTSASIQNYLENSQN